MYNKQKYQKGGVGRSSYLYDAYTQLLNLGSIGDMSFEQFTQLPHEKQNELITQVSASGTTKYFNGGGTGRTKYQLNGTAGTGGGQDDASNVAGGMSPGLTQGLTSFAGGMANYAGNLIAGDKKPGTAESVGGSILAGTGQGAMAGSAFGPIGTAVGAGIGAIGSVIKSITDAKQYKNDLADANKADNIGNLSSGYNPQLAKRGGYIQDVEKRYAQSRSNLQPHEYSFFGRDKVNKDSTGIGKAGFDNRPAPVVNGNSPYKYFNEMKHGGMYRPNYEMEDGGEANVEIEDGEAVIGNPQGMTLHGGAKSNTESPMGMMVSGAEHGQKNAAGTEGIPVSFHKPSLNPEGAYIGSKYLRPDGRLATGKGKTPRDSVAGHMKKPLEYISKAEESMKGDRYFNNPIAIQAAKEELAYQKDRAEEGKFMHGLNKVLKQKDRKFGDVIGYIKENNPNNEASTIEGVDMAQVQQESQNKQGIPTPAEAGMMPLPKSPEEVMMAQSQGQGMPMGMKAEMPQMGQPQQPQPMMGQRGGYFNSYETDPQLYNEDYNDLQLNNTINNTFMRKGGYYQDGGMMPGQPMPPQQPMPMEQPMGGQEQPMDEMGGGEEQEMQMLQELYQQLTQMGIIDMPFEEFAQLPEEQIQQLMQQAEQMMSQGSQGMEEQPGQGMPPQGMPEQGMGIPGGMEGMMPPAMRYGGRSYQRGGTAIPTGQNPWRNRTFSQPVNNDYYGESSHIQARTTSPYMYGGRVKGQNSLNVPGIQQPFNAEVDANAYHKASIGSQPLIGQNVPKPQAPVSRTTQQMYQQEYTRPQQRQYLSNARSAGMNVPRSPMKFDSGSFSQWNQMPEITDFEYQNQLKDFRVDSQQQGAGGYRTRPTVGAMQKYGGAVSQNSPYWVNMYKNGGRILAQSGVEIKPEMMGSGMNVQGMQNTGIDNAMYQNLNKERGIARPVIDEVGQYEDLDEETLKNAPISQYKGYDVLEDDVTIEDYNEPTEPQSSLQKSTAYPQRPEVESRESSNYADRQSAANAVGDVTSGRSGEITNYYNEVIPGLLNVEGRETDDAIGAVGPAGIKRLKDLGFDEEIISTFSLNDIDNLDHPIARALSQEIKREAAMKNKSGHSTKNDIFHGVADRTRESINRGERFNSNRIRRETKNKMTQEQADGVAMSLNNLMDKAEEQGIDVNDPTAFAEFMQQNNVDKNPLIKDYYGMLNVSGAREISRQGLVKLAIDEEDASMEEDMNPDLSEDPESGKRLTFNQAFGKADKMGVPTFMWNGREYPVDKTPTPRKKVPNKPDFDDAGFGVRQNRANSNLPSSMLPYEMNLPPAMRSNPGRSTPPGNRPGMNNTNQSGRRLSGQKTTPSSQMNRQVQQAAPKKEVTKKTYSFERAGKKLGGMTSTGQMKRGDYVKFQYGGQAYEGSVKYYDPNTGNFELD